MPVYLAGANVVSEAVLCDRHLQVRVVLPGVSVGGVLPAAGPGGQLDTWQQETQTKRHLQLPHGRTATPWRRRHAGSRRETHKENMLMLHRLDIFFLLLSLPKLHCSFLNTKSNHAYPPLYHTFSKRCQPHHLDQAWTHRKLFIFYT